MQKIFVSSTFRDFQVERDYIRNSVQPRLSEFAHQYGDTVSFVDLRWGINTSGISIEESERKVLSVCLNEIRQSKPYMIVLLGNRYGYEPGGNVIEKEASRMNVILRDWQISVTQLEIEYGAFSEEARNSHIFFYIREMECPADSSYAPESESAKRKLDALKARIMSDTGGRVRFYKAQYGEQGPDQVYLRLLGDDILTDLESVMSQELEAFTALDEYERDQLCHWNYLRDKREYFLARGDTVSRVMEGLREPGSCIAVSGEPGSGKSTLFAEAVSRFKAQGGEVLLFFCGITGKTSSVGDILIASIHILSKMCGEVLLPEITDYSNPEAIMRAEEKLIMYRERLNSLCRKIASSGKRLLIAIDAVDQIHADRLRDQCQYLPDVDTGVRILITGVSESYFPPRASVFVLAPLNDTEKLEVIHRTTYIAGKELSAETIRSILKKKGTGNSLYLYLLIQRLLVLQSKDYSSIYCGSSTSDATQDYLQHLIDDVPEDIEALAYSLVEWIDRSLSGTLMPAIEALAVSRYGLRQNDLEHLYSSRNEEFVPLDFVLFVNYLDELFFYRGDGRIDFLHRIVRKAVLEHITNKKQVHNALIRILFNLKEDDPIRMQELQYHLIAAEKTRMYMEYISSVMRAQNIDAIRILTLDFWYICAQNNEGWINTFFERITQPHDLETLYPCDLPDNPELISTEDYVNFYYYLSTQVLKAADTRLSDIHVALFIANRCIEAAKVLYDQDSDDTDYAALYSSALIQKAVWLRELSGDPNYRKAVECAEMACELWEQVVDIRETEQNILEMINKRFIAILCSQESSDIELQKKALEWCDVTIQVCANVIQKRPALEWIRKFLVAHLMAGVTCYNMGRYQNGKKSIEYFTDGLEFIRGFDRETIDAYLADLEREFVDHLINLGQIEEDTDSQISDILEKVNKCRREFASNPSVSKEESFVGALKNAIRVLADGESADMLSSALELAKEAIEHAEHINSVQPTAQSCLTLSEVLLHAGTVQMKLARITDNFFFESLSFASYLRADSALDGTNEEDKGRSFYHYRMDIFKRIIHLLSDMPEQRDLEMVFLMKWQIVADEMRKLFSDADSLVYWAEAKLNVALCYIDQEGNDNLRQAIPLLEDVEQSLEPLYTSNPNTEISLYLANACLYHAKAQKMLGGGNVKVKELLEKVVSCSKTVGKEGAFLAEIRDMFGF